MAGKTVEGVKEESRGPGKLVHLLIKKAKGGHIVEHHHENDYKPTRTVVFGKQDGDKLLAHVARHMGIPGAAEEEGEQEHKNLVEPVEVEE